MHFGTWLVDAAGESLTIYMMANIVPNDDGRVSKRSITLTMGELKLFNPAPSSGDLVAVVWRRAK